MFAEKLVNPRLGKTESIGEALEETVSESAKRCRALDNDRRSVAFEAFPDLFDWIEVR